MTTNVSSADFLKEWVSDNVASLPAILRCSSTQGDSLIRVLAQKLRDDATMAGFSIADLGIKGLQVEPFMREMLAHVGEPGTPGD